MIPMFIASTLFLAFALYNWFFILKKMDKETIKVLSIRIFICTWIAVVVLFILMGINSISGI